MKTKFIFALMAVALVGCSKKADNNAENINLNNEEVYDEVAAETTANNLVGSWRLNEYAGETEIQTVPADADYELTFTADGNFTFTTDCNQIFGVYNVSGDSLVFDSVGRTLMACPSADVEDAMIGILPRISTYAVFGDSILNLRSDARTMALFSVVATDTADATTNTTD